MEAFGQQSASTLVVGDYSTLSGISAMAEGMISP